MYSRRSKHGHADRGQAGGGGPGSGFTRIAGLTSNSGNGKTERVKDVFEDLEDVSARTKFSYIK